MKILRWLAVGVLFIGLIAVRKFETQLFYDPLLDYFHQDFLNFAFPNIALGKHLLSITSRYLINMGLSLGIIWFIFQDPKATKFAAITLGMFFLIFLIPYVYYIKTEFTHFYTAGFYIRRMLIQPVLLLILIPAIWYWKKVIATAA